MPKPIFSESVPPLIWLRAFEAAGRLGSFKGAAQELHVSPSTISHQIRDLEKFLGRPLFSRRSSGIELTTEGAVYIEPLSRAFNLLRSAGDKTPKPANELRVGAFPFLANEILTPRLAELQEVLETPIKLHTHTDLELLSHVDSNRRLDVLIRYGRTSGFPGYLSEPLFDIQMVPILGPGLEHIKSAEDLLAQNLIHVMGPYDGWSRWLDKYSPGHEPEFAIEIDSFHAAALAVSRGQGVCLGVSPLIAPWIADHKILALADLSIDTGTNACIVYAHYNHENHAISQFGEWLVNLLQPG